MDPASERPTAVWMPSKSMSMDHSMGANGVTSRWRYRPSFSRAVNGRLQVRSDCARRKGRAGRARWDAARARPRLSLALTQDYIRNSRHFNQRAKAQEYQQRKREGERHTHTLWARPSSATRTCCASPALSLRRASPRALSPESLAILATLSSAEGEGLRSTDDQGLLIGSARADGSL